MKKSTLSFLFVATSAIYVFYIYLSNSNNIFVSALPVIQSIIPPAPINQNNNTQSSISEISTPTKSSLNLKRSLTVSSSPASIFSTAPVSRSVSEIKPIGMYIDGTYTGNPIDAYYGIVQVEIGIKNGKLISVKFLQYPNDRNTSRYINSQAMPILESEAIQSQSANVDIISGATNTSTAFKQSLAGALKQAKI